MNMRQLYNESAFLARVNFAEKCFRSHQTNTRAMDTCFEMYDGASRCVLFDSARRQQGKLRRVARFRRRT